MPWLSRLIDPISNGIPLQRANTYTYRTEDFLLASVQHYHPGTLNDQQHIWSATISPQLSIFTVHPPLAKTKFATDKNHGYWVGPGRLPDAAQDKNICMLIYRLPKHLAAGELGECEFTHGYFPKDKFNRVEIKGSRAYGQLGKTYVALLGNSPLLYQAGSSDDLIQAGRETTWICEISTAAEDGDFDSFVHRIESNQTSYVDGRLTYQTRERRLELDYGQHFRVNGVLQNSEFARHDSPYAKTARKPDQITIAFGGHRLLLDFKNRTRLEE